MNDRAYSQRKPAPTRSEYHVPGGTIVFTSRQWPPFIAIRFDGQRMGARRTYQEAEELLAEYALGVAGRAAE